MATSTLIDQVASLVAAREWEQVREVLGTARAHEELGGRLLEWLAEAHWWLGAVDECIAVRRDALETLERDADHRSAGRLALLLSEDYRRQGRDVIGESWRRRAGQLLKEVPECSEHGYLLLYQGEESRRHEDLETARRLVEQAESIARRVADSDLAADVKQEMGRIMIESGAHSEGLATMDDAMLSASDGQLSLYTTGKIYCCVMSACDRVGDVARASEWEEVSTTWLQQDRLYLFPGMCRVHRAELLAHHGHWNEAQQEALLACDELREMGWVVAFGHITIGQIRCRRGDYEGAAAQFLRAEQLGASPDPGLSLLLHAQGQTIGGLKRLVRALSSASMPALSRFRLLPTLVELAIAVNDEDLATTAAAEIEDIAGVYKTSKMLATATSSRSQLALALGDWVCAAAESMTAIHQWQELAAPYEVARARVIHARACRSLDDHHSWETSLNIAANIFQSLGAVGDLAEVEQLRGNRGSVGLRDSSSLTTRELEVLRLLATGMTNKAIASALVVSQKTISRHLSNMFTKLSVETRAAATAYAYEHDLIVKR
jgi:ATP/maltotriose-dependent transcriptional regulator MalT